MINLQDAMVAYTSGAIIGVLIITGVILFKVSTITNKEAIQWIKKIGKELLSLSLIALQWFILYQGAIQNKTWAWNIFIFAQWLITFMIILYLMARTQPTTKRLQEEDRRLPGWFTLLSDVAIALVLAATGHFFYASLTIVQQMLESAAFNNAKKEETKEDPVIKDKRAYPTGSQVMESIWDSWHDYALGIKFPETSHEEAFAIAERHINNAIAETIQTTKEEVA